MGVTTTRSALHERHPSRWKLAGAGLLAGGLAGLVMTTLMLLLASMFGIATPLAIMGDRLSVFIPADDFLALMGQVGGYNRMKQLGVSSVMLGQIVSSVPPMATARSKPTIRIGPSNQGRAVSTKSSSTWADIGNTRRSCGHR